jgi:hypothetical protein
VPLNPERVRQRLADFALEPLFIEDLGWDRYPGRLEVAVDGQNFTLNGIAEKRGMVAFHAVSANGRLPDFRLRRKIERQAARSVHEHLIVYADGDRRTQVWQWVGRESGRATPREHIYQQGQSGEALVQKLDRLVFTLDEEGGLTIVDVTQRARAAFDVERVTKRFYERFKSEHEAFLGFITGLKNEDDLEWYASVMLNRLMFVYFIQKKGFLDGDRDYLRNRLRRVQREAGPDQFHSFYRYFLLKLFHEGLGQHPRNRASELDSLLGTVPYLNGGLFDVHELEQSYPDIQIPDEAFTHLFDFFDSYQWHLDDRPLRADNEVNPDVLGYIFEKYVNQKQMGAYYTKEDITDYITSKTLIPRLFEKLADASPEFSQATVARFLAAEPDQYIHGSIRHGTELDLPAEVAGGVDDPTARDGWNATAPPAYALPTETWREVVVRRQRYAELHSRLADGDLSEASELVALNLRLRQLAEDVVDGCNSPSLLLAIYRTLESMSVLDPTCGSGAFLFAALNILEPLYEATLERMEAFVVDDEADEEDAEFAAITERVKIHPNRTFFVLKTIVVNNLYGVDVMEEAVEICKLRLFLRLVSQVDRVEHLEPLPDIDFNVRTGNTLVGFADLDDVRRAILGGDQAKLDVAGAMERVTEEAVRAEDAFEQFHRLQLADDHVGGSSSATAKEKLRSYLSSLRSELDRYLAGEYGVSDGDEEAFAQWRSTHQPFHWFTEFYGLMRDGGFDAVVGNPPYLEVGKLGGRYRPLAFETLGCRDIYAWVVERAFALRGERGHFGLIVPVSISSSGSFAPLRRVIEKGSATLLLSHFANRPGQLFAGAQNRLTISLHAPNEGKRRIFSTRYHRWDGKRGERDELFALLRYVELGDLAGSFHGLLPKVGTPEAVSILRKLGAKTTVAAKLVRSSRYPVWWVRVPGYFCQFHLQPPMARPESGGEPRVRGEVNSIYLPDERTQRVLHAVLNSSTYYQFYVAYSDGRHINPGDVRDFPFDFEAMSDEVVEELVELSRRLEDAARANTSLWRKSGLLIDSLDSRPLKSVLDEVDRVLANHYGFSELELDHLINYDIKYRVGTDDEA